MTEQDAGRFDSGLVALAAVTGKTLDMGIKSAYFVALADVPGDVVLAAMKKAMVACEFFPSAAEVRALCDEAEQEEERKALQAYTPHALLPESDAQYRGDHWEADEPTYHCRTCRDTSFVYFQKVIRGEASRWVRKCECILEPDDALKNPVIMARIRHERERCGLRKNKYAVTRQRKRERSYGDS
jgi:hypothetical protein